jgi:hypothetical protein
VQVIHEQNATEELSSNAADSSSTMEAMMNAAKNLKENSPKLSGTYANVGVPERLEVVNGSGRDNGGYQMQTFGVDALEMSAQRAPSPIMGLMYNKKQRVRMSRDAERPR